MCSTYSKIHTDKYLPDIFRIQNGLKQGYALLPLLFDFALQYAMRKAQKNQMEMKLNGTSAAVYADHLNFFGHNINTIKITETLSNAKMDDGLEANTETPQYMLLSLSSE
jgi:hypothetical protein